MIVAAMLSWLQEWLPGNRQEDTPGQRSHDSDYVEPYPHSDDKEAGELGQEQKAVVQNTAFRVSRLILDGATTFQICDIIRRCPYKHQLLSERDFYGYNALQYAVICARVDLMLEMVRFGADINLPICGRPLHLACKLGHADIVKALLSHGADPQVSVHSLLTFHDTKRSLLLDNSLSYSGFVWLVVWLCLTSHRQLVHLETAPTFTVPCEGREARFLHCPHRESNPGLLRGSPLHNRCTTPTPLTFI